MDRLSNISPRHCASARPRRNRNFALLAKPRWRPFESRRSRPIKLASTFHLFEGDISGRATERMAKYP